MPQFELETVPFLKFARKTLGDGAFFSKKPWTSAPRLDRTIRIRMSFFSRARNLSAGFAGTFLFSLASFAQVSLSPVGGEFAPVDAMIGDQVQPNLSLGSSGGYLVWEDNASGRAASVINATRLDSSFHSTSIIHVNKATKGEAQKPKVQILKDGRAVFVWQGNPLGAPDIYARFVNANGDFVTSDVRVNSYVKDTQINPAVTSLGDGALIVWQSYKQDGNFYSIHARRFSGVGAALGTELLINQNKAFNQRTPAVATLANGNFVVSWVSDEQRFPNSVDILARIFSPTGVAVGDEFRLNSNTNICANPSVAPLASGGFTVVWGEKDAVSLTNSWDIVGRSFSADGLPTAPGFGINTFLYGDQFAPHIASTGDSALVVWTSLRQDGSWEGVFGRLLSGGQIAGDEFKINQTTVSRQIHPTVSSNGANKFLVNWSCFKAITSFDLFGQAYSIQNNQP